jgi:hypothetical protein
VPALRNHPRKSKEPMPAGAFVIRRSNAGPVPPDAAVDLSFSVVRCAHGASCLAALPGRQTARKGSGVVFRRKRLPCGSSWPENDSRQSRLSLRGCEKIGTGTFATTDFPEFSPFRLEASPIFSQPLRESTCFRGAKDDSSCFTGHSDFPLATARRCASRRANRRSDVPRASDARPWRNRVGTVPPSIAGRRQNCPDRPRR